MKFSIIWFNPDLSKYQAGPLGVFKEIRNASMNYGRFELIGSVPANNSGVAERIANNLNIMRDPN